MIFIAQQSGFMFSTSCVVYIYLLLTFWVPLGSCGKNNITLRETNSSPLKIGQPKRTFHRWAIDFQVRAVSFKEGRLPKTNIAGWNISIFTRKYIGSNGRNLAFAMFFFQGKVPFQFRCPPLAPYRDDGPF